MKEFKRLINGFILFMPLGLCFTGCEVSGDIFKAGIWVAVLFAVALTAVIFIIVLIVKK